MWLKNLISRGLCWEVDSHTHRELFCPIFNFEYSFHITGVYNFRHSAVCFFWISSLPYTVNYVKMVAVEQRQEHWRSSESDWLLLLYQQRACTYVIMSWFSAVQHAGWCCRHHFVFRSILIIMKTCSKRSWPQHCADCNRRVRLATLIALDPTQIFI